MAFRFEDELEKAAIPFLEKNFSIYSMQVPLYNRVIDCAAIDRKNNIVGIEFKLKNWKRALEQANKNSNSFDFIYVCLPNGSYLPKLVCSANQFGIGVLIYDTSINKVRIELPASKIKRQWKPNLNYVREYLMERGIN